MVGARLRRSGDVPMVNLRLLTIRLATLFVPGVAFAEGAVPRLHHAPISVSTAHQALLITGDIDHPELVKRAILVYRVADSGPYMEVEFKRGAPGPYVAEIPEETSFVKKNRCVCGRNRKRFYHATIQRLAAL